MAEADGGMKGEVVDLVAAAAGDDRCLVALGGGADSAVLLWASVEALGAARVTGVFVFHGLEGSEALRASATSLANHLGVECLVLDGVIEDGGNLEARARDARYSALENEISEGVIGFTGHTADDQAETVLMRLLRGSGAGALAGIPTERGAWRRPLLTVSRSTLRSIAEELGLPFTDDPANDDDRFTRSRIRNRVMPVLESEYGAEAPAMIRQSASLLALDEAELDNAADEIPLVRTDSGVSIPTGPLAVAPEAVASRAVRKALRTVLDGYPGAQSDVEAVLAVAKGGDDVTISSALQVSHEPPFVTIHQLVDDTVPDGFDVATGDSFVWSDQRYSIKRVADQPAHMTGGRFIVMSEAVAGGGVHVRGVQPGDRIEIATGTTPVVEVLRVAGVPSRMRRYSLVVTIDGKIAALDGVRTAPWARAKRGQSAIVIEREVDTWK